MARRTALACSGARVVLACRSRERGERAAAAVGGELVVLDLADLASVRAGAAEIRELTGDRVDVLIDNAGIPAVVVDNAGTAPSPPEGVRVLSPGRNLGYGAAANLAARHLLNAGRALNGEAFDEVVASAPAPLAQAIADGGDGLFNVTLDDEDETFHLSQREFKLQGRAHRLFQIRRMTRELARQEVATWKKVIRVISHELNNSLGPIRSLSHTGRLLAQRGDVARLTTVFDTVEERTRHLEGFIQGYARFAKLPAPRRETVAWAPFLDALARHYAFVLRAPPPAQAASFDRAQIEQALINLLKNAHEAGGAHEGVELAVTQGPREVRIEVADRGSGMSETVFANALLPFYSTKRSGSGLGLALVREIAEAHGGRVQLVNRRSGGLRVALVLPSAGIELAPP